jgi:23S rRNA pseudouridine1911/1915/1917 synthase
MDYNHPFNGNGQKANKQADNAMTVSNQINNEQTAGSDATNDHSVSRGKAGSGRPVSQEAVVHTLTVNANAGKRLDAWLSQELAEISRTYIQKLIEGGRVQVNGRTVPANYKVKAGDVLTVLIPAPAALEVKAEKIPLDIIYEDQDVLVINKPQGMVVHPAHGNYEGTLVNALLAHCPDLSGIGGVSRPGIVHRIDKDTSGLLMVAKNDLAHQGLTEQIKEHSVIRRYLALVHGQIQEPAGRIETPVGRHPHDRKKMAVVVMGGKLAITHYRVLERFRDYTLIEARLETGRTHQIRVHLAYLGHPVAGDPVYGYRRPHLGLTGQALHAGVLGFKHPRTGEELLFSVPAPPYFQQILEELRQQNLKVNR